VSGRLANGPRVRDQDPGHRARIKKKKPCGPPLNTYRSVKAMFTLGKDRKNKAEQPNWQNLGQLYTGVEKTGVGKTKKKWRNPEHKKGKKVKLGGTNAEGRTHAGEGRAGGLFSANAGKVPWYSSRKQKRLTENGAP